MANSLVQKKKPFSLAIQGDMFKNLINNTLGDPKRAARFTAAITSAVAVNPALQECEASTILSAGLLGESLGLSPSPQLGQYYIIPFNKKNRNGDVISTVATFQLGAKGYKQLAMRSGQYLDIDCIEIRDGEYKGRDKATGKHKFEFVEDDEVRESKPIIGYLAYFELLNGFKKQLYWSVSKMEKHANSYSQAFNLKKYHELQEGKIPKSELWKYSSYWYKNFNEMAEKTMIKQLISKWGIMSIEMQGALESDMVVVDEQENKTYVDTDEDYQEVTAVTETAPETKQAETEEAETEDVFG